MKKCFKLLGIKFHVDLEKITDINFKEKKQKIKSLIKIWKRRYLTPLGKITVIKSLLLPLLNHLFTSLPNLSNHVVKELNTLFYEFLWEGPAKIKQTVITKQYSDGGLKMINLQAFISSMKATWLRRWIQTDSEWKDLNSNINFKKLFDFGKAYADSIIKQISNPFWEDVIKAYSNVLELNQQSTEDFALSSPIFFNHNILIVGKPVFFSQWYMKGITYINDIINNSGDFYSEQELKTKYNIKTIFSSS